MIEVRSVEKQFGVFVNGELLGTTKLECDARFHANRIGAIAGVENLTIDERKLVEKYIERIVQSRESGVWVDPLKKQEAI